MQTRRIMIFPERRSFRCALPDVPAVLALIALLPTEVLAQATEAPGVATGAILQMLFGLALIVGLLFFGAYLLRRLNGGRHFGHGGPLRIVGGLMLSARERIILVEVGDEWILVGVVPGQIKTLHTLPKGELPADSPGSSDKPFGQWLRQMTERSDDKK